MSTDCVTTNLPPILNYHGDKNASAARKARAVSKWGIASGDTVDVGSIGATNLGADDAVGNPKFANWFEPRLLDPMNKISQRFQQA